MIYQSYDSQTGGINYTLEISPESAKAAVEQFGEHLVEGEGDGRTHYVDVRASPPILREKRRNYNWYDWRVHQRGYLLRAWDNSDSGKWQRQHLLLRWKLVR